MPKTKKTRQGRKKCGVAGQPKHVLTEEEQRKGREAAKAAVQKNAAVRKLVTNLGEALRDELSKVDEALQITNCQIIAKRFVQHLKVGKHDHVLIGTFDAVRDTADGRPTQAVIVSETKDIDGRPIHELLFWKRNRRFPLPEEEDWYKQYGTYPDQA